MASLSPPPPPPRYDDSDYEVDDRGTFRALVEAFVSLFIAVLMFRTFAAEGYMISTGSMAPSLLGFHKRVVCPTCRMTFPFGTAYDTDEDPENDEALPNRTRAVCPNCGQPGIDVTDVPRNHGDQLLVNKQAYLFQPPKRWDIIVFRNPAHPTEAYVKRAVGLPGEKIQIVRGDIHIDGQIARKDYRQQLATRILVHDYNFRPVNDHGYKSHWQIVEPEPVDSSQPKPVSWAAANRSFYFRGAAMRRPDKDAPAWIEYHHWVRIGGSHESSVPLAHWPDNLRPESVPSAGLKYEPAKHEFSVTGALSDEVSEQLQELTTDETFKNAVRDLHEASHIVAITDDYGYNPPDEAGPANLVRDLMLELRIKMQGGAGEFIIELTDGSNAFGIVFDVIRREVNLFAEPLPEGATLNSQVTSIGSRSEPVATKPWPESLSNLGGNVEVSIFDRQLLIAIDGKPLMDPWPISASDDGPAPRIPIRIGARGVDISISQLKLYRDVYYTDTRSRHAVAEPLQIGEDEFFVLGDNSPVSHDSRRWDDPFVHRSYLIGKPFLVHLPSKPANLKIGNKEMHLRMPDWERIRLIK